MVVYLLCYAAAYLFAGSGHPYLAGFGLIVAAMYLYYEDYKKTGTILHLRGIFALSWIGGQGLACFKLSKLGAEWSSMTWICFFAAFLAFWAVFEGCTYYFGELEEERRGRKEFRGMEPAAFFSVCAITVVSLGCFVIEATALGYIPLFVKGVPHAYSYFHLTGVHYFTVSCVLVPALSVLWFSMDRGRNRGKMSVMILMDIIALMIPVLCVSRFQTMMSILLALLTYVLIDSRLKIAYVLGGFAVLVPLYLLLSVARSHDVLYLNSIFEMKNSNTPIFITQPYMYVANNYENFNCLVEGLSSHSWGLRMTAPLWTLSGLKFAFPALMEFPLYVNKEELTTLTMIYDAYYDFGVIGVTLFTGVLGAVSYGLMRMKAGLLNPVGYVFYAQVALYLLLSFFTTWFSNPTTWFYFAITAVAAVAATRRWGGR